jgi:hypothetical protein
MLPIESCEKLRADTRYEDCGHIYSVC